MGGILLRACVLCVCISNPICTISHNPCVCALRYTARTRYPREWNAAAGSIWSMSSSSGGARLLDASTLPSSSLPWALLLPPCSHVGCLAQEMHWILFHLQLMSASLILLGQQSCRCSPTRVAICPNGRQERAYCATSLNSSLFSSPQSPAGCPSKQPPQVRNGEGSKRMLCHEVFMRLSTCQKLVLPLLGERRCSSVQLRHVLRCVLAEELTGSD
jgi:hypothetical protein